MRARLGLGSVLFFSALLMYCFNLNSYWSSDHPTSFLDLDYAIWAHHSFSLGSVGLLANPNCPVSVDVFVSHCANSVDIFAYHGHYFAAPAPGTALFALPFAILGFATAGGFSVFGNVMILSELFVALMNSVAVYFLFKLCRLYFRQTVSAFVALAYAFSTNSWPFATFLFQSDVSAAFVLIAVYFVLKSCRQGGNALPLLLAGLAAGAAMVTDYVTALIVPLLLAFVVLRPGADGTMRRALTAVPLVIGSLSGVLAIALYNLSSYGSILVSSEQLYLNSHSILGNFTTPIYSGAYLDLFTPYRGIFFFSPVLVLGVVGYRSMLKRASGVSFEGFLLLASFLVLFLPYCAWYDPDGGLSFGQRFVIPALPFLMLPMGFVISRSGRLPLLAAYILYGVGVIVNGLAALTSALAGGGNWWSSPFVYSTLLYLQQGTLDQWWNSAVGSYWPVGVALVIGAALLAPILVLRRDWVGSRKVPDEESAALNASA